MVHCGRCKRHLNPGKFSPSARHNGAWCRECSAAYYLRKFDRTPRECESPLCSNVFTPKQAKHIFCSARCKQRGLYHRRTAGQRAGRTCSVCGADISHLRLDAKWCSEACSRAGRPQHAAIQRRSHIKGLYGITTEEYDAMLEVQGGVCAICKGEKVNGYGKRLAIDHCHDSKRVRGILCGKCNRGLGSFDHDPALLAAAAEYLKT